MAINEEELRSLLMTVKEKNEKADLKLNIQKTKIMASCLITPWKIDGEKVETVTDFIFLGSKNHCELLLPSWNLKMLAPWNKSYDKLREHAKKQSYLFANRGSYKSKLWFFQ